MTRAEKLINLLRPSSLLVNYFKGYMPGYPEKIARYNTGYPVTFCNTYALDVLDSEITGTGTGGFIGGKGALFPNGFNYEIEHLRPGFSRFDIIINTTPKQMLPNLKKAAAYGTVKELTAIEAQKVANQEGDAIIAITWDHIAIVSPDFVLNEKGYNIGVVEYKTERGPMLCQAGSYNGRGYANDPRLFGAGRMNEIRYFVLPRKE